MKRFVMALLVAGLAFPGLATATDPGAAPQAQQKPADNSARNVRDRDGDTLTPADQARGSDADVKLTREIREAVVDDDSLSMNAHNVKIITLSGVVTLRGPVDSQTEKTKIAAIAAKHAGGASKVTDQLEVAP
jgi:hyperosmotically inducible periplasmic protein